MTEGVQRRLVFLISPPRAGSTLLARILHATPHVCSRPEPHLVTPLAHLGAWDRVSAAPYDPIISQRAIRGLMGDLPDGEAVMLDACRAYADTVYRALLAEGGARFFLDKTPAYALVLPFLTRLYPEARYIVLTRHPAAIAASQARTFFGGDLAEAERISPILPRYVPAIAAMLADPPRYMCHIRYEELVTAPEDALEALSTLLGVRLPASALAYQRVPMAGTGPGDPVGVGRHARPEAAHADAWRAWFDAEKRAIVERQLSAVSDAELALWGHPRETLWAGGGGEALGTRLRLRRRLLLWGRRLSRTAPVRRAVIAVRDGCEVLLRG